MVMQQEKKSCTGSIWQQRINDNDTKKRNEWVIAEERESQLDRLETMWSENQINDKKTTHRGWNTVFKATSGAENSHTRLWRAAGSTTTDIPQEDHPTQEINQQPD